MNPVDLIPSNASDFADQRLQERQSRCTALTLSIVKCDVMALELQRAALDDATKRHRLRFIGATMAKLKTQHTDTHQCYPFSRN